jgi:hypothetical protein
MLQIPIALNDPPGQFLETCNGLLTAISTEKSRVFA